LSKFNIEIDDHLDMEVGDSVVVIKKDGSVGKVILPEMNNETQHTAGYKKMLQVLEILKPGSKEDIIKHNRKKLH
tara:strand:+ start:2076 stop:2300 length:225 start_codon:yes stop_codon:yes gene_type:complete